MKLKKLLAVLLAAAMTMSLAACGGSSSSAAAETTAAQTTEAAVQETTAAPAETQAAEVVADPYIPIPEEYRAWDDSGSINFNRSGSSKTAMVTTSKYEASQIGKTILENGGNAVDAAVAIAFALSVCEPFTSGLGGGGFMTIYKADTGEVQFLNYREVAAAATTRDLYLNDAGEVDDQLHASGGLAVGVPGELAGLMYALENYGTMSREDVITPAKNLAEQGWTATPYYSASVGWGLESMQKYPELGKVFLDENGLAPVMGTTVTNPDYAKALQLIIDQGQEAIYGGEIGQAIVDTVTKYGGVMTMDDLKNYKVEVLEPAEGTYKGYDIVSSSSPSSGGTCLVQILNILENFDVYEKDSAEQIHLLSEIQKMVYADRAQYMADYKFAEVPTKGLTSKDYAKKLAEKIDMEKAQTYEYDDPWAFEGDNTNGFVVVDAAGDMVAVTNTVNYYWGSGLCADGYGIVLNNQMDDFSYDAESVNCVQAGMTPLSSMSPTVVFKDGKPVMMLSAPGGSNIFAILAELIVDVIDYGMTAEEAIAANRTVDQSGTLNYSDGLEGTDAIKKLEEMGHEPNHYGTICLPSIIVVGEDGTITGSIENSDEGIFLDGVALGY